MFSERNAFQDHYLRPPMPGLSDGPLGITLMSPLGRGVLVGVGRRARLGVLRFLVLHCVNAAKIAFVIVICSSSRIRPEGAAIGRTTGDLASAQVLSRGQPKK